MAKKYTTIFFDLDGTIIDSGEGVSNSVLYALERFGIKETKENALKFIGPPLAESFKEFYGFDSEKATRGIKIYREYYREKGIYECYLYDGIKELLGWLKSEGYKVVLCTSKPEEYAHRVLNYFGILDLFDFACGATMDEKTRAPLPPPPPRKRSTTTCGVSGRPCPARAISASSTAPGTAA